MQVMVRIRPANKREISLVGQSSCLQPRGVSGLGARADGRKCDFTFDHVIGSDSSQEDVFSCMLLVMLRHYRLPSTAGSPPWPCLTQA